jgi:transposase
MSTNFIPVDRNTIYLFPPSVQDWLPEDHLARFVVDIVSQLDLRSITDQYGGRGSKAYHPRMLLALLFYGYATGVFSSRKLEQATYDSVAFRFIAANNHPDHDTIATFRKRFLGELKPLFVQILVIAKEMGLLKLGKVSLDGTKVKANASKHRALSWGHACKIEKQLQNEVEELMRLARDADAADIPEGMDIPEELTRRQDRLAAIADAKEKIRQRAEERYTREKQEYDEKIAARKAKEKKTGKKPGGRKPKPPTSGPRDKDQVNLTDEESRIMPSSKGFKQAYNAQVSVDLDTMVIVTSHVSQSPNDKQEVVPTIEALKSLSASTGTVDTLLADTGYFSESNVTDCSEAEIEPLIATGRQSHNQPLQERFSQPEELPEDAGLVDRMKHHLKTSAGRQLYAKRKSTVEPVFGIIKQVMGFRQFLLRGYEAVSGEWTLVSIAWNLKRMFALNG